jgi:hypothetical protein
LLQGQLLKDLGIGIDSGINDSDAPTASNDSGTVRFDDLNGDGDIDTRKKHDPTSQCCDPQESEDRKEKICFIRTVELWISACETSHKALEDRVHDNNTTSTPGGLWPHEMSLVATYSTTYDTKADNVATESEASKFVTHHPIDSTKKKLAKCSSYNVNGCATLLVVAWQDVKLRTGRVCDVKDGKVLALVPARHSAMDFTNCEIILNTIHLRPHKEGPKSRPDLPPLAAHLYKMYDAAMTRQNAGHSESLTIDPCVWCNQCCNKISTSSRTPADRSRSQPPCTATASPTAQSVSTDSATAIPTIASSSSENPDEEGEPIFVCSLCLLPCHLSCSIQAFANIDRFVPSGLMMKFPTIKPESVPGRLSGLAGHSGVESSLQTLCAFCKGSIQ